MTELIPECRWRGCLQDNGKYQCFISSQFSDKPKLNAPNGMSPSVCVEINPATGRVKCPYIDRPADELKPQGEAPEGSPSLSTKLIGLGTSLLNFALKGFPVVSTEVKEERLAICQKCEEYLGEDLVSPKCRACGCYLELKVSMATEACPKKLWLATAVSQERASGGGCGGCGSS